MRESEYDHAFAEGLENSQQLRTWLLAGGRFARYSRTARLMREEQAAVRKAAHWWKHWWCTMPDGTQGETDIFVVFEDNAAGRFAIHIENKPPHGVLKFPQAAAYRRRAAFKANDPRWLDYQDFETLLLAPAAFLAAHSECLRQFDRGIAYEDVAAFVSRFEVTPKESV